MPLNNDTRQNLQHEATLLQRRLDSASFAHGVYVIRSEDYSFALAHIRYILGQTKADKPAMADAPAAT